jgi:hypothetical protein
MDPTQLYETTIYDRDHERGFSFVTVPARALVFPDPPQIEQLADELGLKVLETPERPYRGLDAVEPWSLPFLIDALIADRTDPAPWLFFFRVRSQRPPSDFAQYLSYQPVVPVESSPLSSKALVQLLAGGGGASGAIGYLTGHPLFMFYSAAGIIVCGVATGVAEALRIGGRTTLLRWMGIDVPPDDEPREAEPAGGVDDEDDDEAY